LKVKNILKPKRIFINISKQTTMEVGKLKILIKITFENEAG
jgi:hypothetical protein